MQFTESWLRSIVNPSLDTQALSEKLTMAGLEVEELEPVAPAFSNVVVGLVIKKDKHPDADRLSVCLVDVGDGSPKQIVCGAPNVAEGLKVPCALPGAVLPGDFKIKPTKMRGVESGGMLCAAKELGISSDSSGLLILSADAPVGQSVRDLLNLDDHVFTLKMTPNRADCLSVRGVAREVSALTGSPIKSFDFKAVSPSIDETYAVSITNPDLCGRFACRVVRGVNVKAETPAWMAERLERSGQRCIDPLVDISNYVMLELGRPSHIFDLDKLTGPLDVRWAKPGESLKLLNEQSVDLSQRVGVVADSSGPQALAGIMGGDQTAVSEATANILIEAAFWYPDAIAGRAREFNFGSEAAHRFERGVDFEEITQHIEYITRLILEVCGGEAGPVSDTVVNLPVRLPVTLRHQRAEAVIGMSFDEATVAGVFGRLGFECEVIRDEAGTQYRVTPPSYRFDIQIEEDLIEEIIRVVGYESLPLRAPKGRLSMLPAPEKMVGRHSLRRSVASQGFQEVVCYGFVPDRWEADFAGNNDPVRLLNPIASHLSVMRSSLIGSHVQVLKHNLGHRVDRLKIFELARVFSKDPSVQDSDSTVAGFKQRWVLGGLAYGLAGPLQWAPTQSRPTDFFDVKGDLEVLLAGRKLELVRSDNPALHPGRAADIYENGIKLGFVGELHPKWVREYELPGAPIVFELDEAALRARSLVEFKPVSRQPVVLRDLAFIVDRSANSADLKKAMEAVGNEQSAWLKSVILFDEFVPKEEGKGLSLKEKSLAFRLTFQTEDRSLTDADLDPVIQGMVAAVGTHCGGRLR